LTAGVGSGHDRGMAPKPAPDPTPRTGSDLAGGPLTGIRVVEMTTAIQGPAAGVYLSDCGAEVLKIEPPIGELNRYLRGPGFEYPVEASGAQYNSMNRGKQSVCLDLQSELGMSVLLRMLDDADVYLTNYRRSALDRLGLGYAALSQRNPRLVYAAVNGFGPLGPDADKAMLDGAAQARGGLASVSGPKDGPPMPPGAAIADSAGAMQTALGVMTALFARERTGRGQLVETSALGAQLWLQMWEVLHHTMTGHRPEREGVHHPALVCPYGIYESADGGAFLFATTMDEPSWDALWIFADMPEVAIDPRWNSPLKRIGASGDRDGVAEVREKLARAFRSKTAAEWSAFLATQPEIIWERVRSYDEVLEDPQVLANDYITSVDIPHVGPTRTVGNLVRMSDTPGSVKGGPPTVGQHTAAVMARYGFSAEQIREMEAGTGAMRDAAMKFIAES
jgi:crotonobetainyl-CoA:carnitine CoA-transferase CaiB-like acyl-CoA transferase